MQEIRLYILSSLSTVHFECLKNLKSEPRNWNIDRQAHDRIPYDCLPHETLHCWAAKATLQGGVGSDPAYPLCCHQPILSVRAEIFYRENGLERGITIHGQPAHKNELLLKNSLPGTNHQHSFMPKETSYLLPWRNGRHGLIFLWVSRWTSGTSTSKQSRNSKNMNWRATPFCFRFGSTYWG